MPESRNRNTRKALRTAFRICRIAILLLIAGVAAFFLWCNIFGLPRIVTAEIQKELRRRGIELEIQNVWLRGITHFVARDVRLKGLTGTNDLIFATRNAEFYIDFTELKRGNFNLSGLRLSSGSLTLPLHGDTGRALTVSNINTDIQLLPGDALGISGFSAEALGARARVTGELKNLSKFQPGKSTGVGGTPWRRQVAEVLRVAEQLTFNEQPEIAITVFADGSDLPNARASLWIQSGAASSKWGTLNGLEIASSIAPDPGSTNIQGKFTSEISGYRGDHGLIEFVRIEGETVWSKNMETLITNRVAIKSGAVDSTLLHFASAEGAFASAQLETNGPIRSTLSLTVGPIDSFTVKSASNVLSANLEHPLPFSSPAVWLGGFFSRERSEEQFQFVETNRVVGDWEFISTGVAAEEMAIESVRLTGKVDWTPSESVDNPALGMWQPFTGLKAPWDLTVTNITSGQIAVGSVQANGDWTFPRLTLNKGEAKLHGGGLEVKGDLDVETREVKLSADAAFAYEKTAVLLDQPVQKWLAQFRWTNPPVIKAQTSFVLPPWVGKASPGKRPVLSTLRISGEFEGVGSFRDIGVEQATSHFHFSNFVWSLPDLVIKRPEGDARIQYTGNVTNSDFRCVIESQLDPAILRPMFTNEQQLAFNMVKFVQPPHLQAEVTGNWEDDSRLSVNASLNATNFFVKEQAFTDLSTKILITNGLIQCSDVVAHRGKEEVKAERLLVDLPGEVMFVTNLISTIDPYIAMSLVGDDAYDAIDPYRFAVAPTVHVNGIVPLRHWSKADIHFGVAGNEFTFWKFRMPSLSGDVFWRSNTIAFSNVTANFYGGTAHWSGYFVVNPSKGVDSANYSFAATTTNTSLKYLVADLTGKTNHMEGTLHGHLVITSANTSNDRSWNGYSNATLEDGFLWNMPLFGVFSPILDGIAPGLGSSRITSGSGTFTITNSVVRTSDMQVRAPTFRLAYKGTVDLDGKLEAGVEALFLRDAWVVGRLFSLALWPVSKAFEARISGTLDAPKTDLKYVPNFLFAPFRILGVKGAGDPKSNQDSNLRRESR